MGPLTLTSKSSAGCLTGPLPQGLHPAQALTHQQQAVQGSQALVLLGQLQQGSRGSRRVGLLLRRQHPRELQ